jgi:hypothetical protein
MIPVVIEAALQVYFRAGTVKRDLIEKRDLMR